MEDNRVGMSCSSQGFFIGLEANKCKIIVLDPKNDLRESNNYIMGIPGKGMCFRHNVEIFNQELSKRIK